MTVKSVGSGKDYTTLVAWEAGEQADLVTATDNAIAEIYGTVSETAEVIFLGWTTSADYKCIIRPAPGQDFDASDYSGATISTSTAFGLQRKTTHVHLERIKYTSSAGDMIYDTTSSVATAYRCCFISSGANRIDNTNYTKAYNNCLFDAQNLSVQINGIVRGTNITLNSCVIVADKSDGILTRDTICYNTIAFNKSTTQTYNTFYQCSGDYNSANDTSAPGENSVDSITDAVFEDAVNDDYHLASGATALDAAGTNLYSTFTEDIDGDTWPSTGDWDIGFDYFVGGALPTTGKIYLGGTEITAMKLGDVDITKAYLGDTQVFGN